MATYFRLLDPGRQFFDSNGAVLNGGLINTYTAGTTTAKLTYQDSLGASSHANPVVLDSDGRIPAQLWGTTGDYKFVVTDSAAGAVFTEDNITPIQDSTANTGSEWVLSGFTVTNTTATAFTIPTDESATFHVGRRLKIADSSTRYATISISSFSSVLTVTVVVDGAAALTASMDGNTTSYGIISVTNSSMASDDGGIYQESGSGNLVINGDFNSWQENTSFAAIASATHVADLFQYSETGATVHTVSRVTDVPTLAESGHLSNYALKIDCTTNTDGDGVNPATDAIAAGDYAVFYYRIEGYDFQAIAQKAFTISFWHKHTKIGTYCVAVKNAATSDRSYVGEYTQTTTDTWEKAVIHVTASPSGGSSWNYTTGIGLTVLFPIFSGTTYHVSAADAWETGNFYATSSQVNAADSTANNMIFSQVKIEKGTIADPQFVGIPIADETAKILRYLYHVAEVGASKFVGVYGTWTTTTAFAGNLNLPVTMRAVGTLADSGDTDFSIASNAVETVNSGLAISIAGTQVVRFNATTSTAVAGDAGLLFIEGATGGYFTIDARL
tara:strand:+ start:835 stop:2505 length:1671 start_codon:yes stop_codon:yes gene_type:complete